ncbi:MAG: transcriptional regulator [Rikenellaceae bacterium]
MLKALNPLLHSELRLAIVSILMNVEEADFTYIKTTTGATSGNLSVQLEKLSKADYITITKGFAGKKPRTVCAITELGRDAFREYVEALRSYVNL